jgi:hypothetical protein
MLRHKHNGKNWVFGISLILKCLGNFVGDTAINQQFRSSYPKIYKN